MQQQTVDDCPVCWEPLPPSGVVTVAACGHSLCGACYARLERPVCPLCRAPIRQRPPFRFVLVCGTGTGWLSPELVSW